MKKNIVNQNNYNIELNELSPINLSFFDENSPIHFIFVYDISCCAGCIERMNMCLKEFSNYKTSKISIIIIQQDFSEVQLYCLNRYCTYLERIDFYFGDYSEMEKFGIPDDNGTPILLAYRNNILQYEYFFNTN